MRFYLDDWGSKVSNVGVAFVSLLSKNSLGKSSKPPAMIIKLQVQTFVALDNTELQDMVVGTPGLESVFIIFQQFL